MLFTPAIECVCCGMERIQIVIQLVSTHGLPHIDHPAKVTLCVCVCVCVCMCDSKGSHN